MRKLSLALLAAGSLTAVTAASASADTYCVAPKTGCGVTNDFGTIASALAIARAAPGDDTILLGAATYREDGLRYDGSDPVTLVGKGRDLTTVQRATSLGGSVTLAGTGPLNVRALRVRLLTSIGPQALDTQGTLFEDLRVDAESGAVSPQGLRLSVDGAVLRDAEIELPAGGQCLVLAAPERAFVRVEDVEIDGCSAAVRNSGAGSSLIARLQADSNYGIDSGAGILTLDDSVLAIRGGGVGVGLSQGASTRHTEVLVRQSTIVGSGGGIGLSNFNHLAPSTSQLTAYDTIVRGFGTSVERDAGAGSTADVQLEFVSYDRDAVVSTGTGTLNSVSPYDDPDPRFVDPAGGDYRLAADSPLVDQDDVPLFDIPPYVEPLTDLDGTLRIVNGRRDLGAYERAMPPTASGDATAIGLDAATIAASLDTGGAPGTWKVLYGPTAAYGSTAASQELPAAAGARAGSAVLTGLSPGTTYHYAVKLTTVMGTVTSADRVFTTTSPSIVAPSPPPRANPAAPPTLSGLALAPAEFRTAARGPSLATTGSSGARLSFVLSAGAAVSFSVKRLTAGVLARGRCLPPRRGRRGRRCTRETQVGRAFSLAARAGPATLRFSGRVGGRRLAPGRYVLLAQPAGGGAPSRVAFRVLRPRQ